MASSLRLPSGEYTTTPEDAAQLLISTHFPGNTVQTGLDDQNSSLIEDNRTFMASDMELAGNIFNNTTTEWSVSSFAPFKSAGPDGIFPAEIQHGLALLNNHLTNIFRACLVLRYIPKEWTRVRVVFIPKPGRNDYTNAKAFRPISLSSCFLKAMERIIDRYIRDHHLTHNPLSKQQHAYTPGKSCETALHSLVSKIEKSMEHKEFALGTFIDIEGAFDNTNFTAIARACSNHGVHTMISHWIDTMLRSRVVEYNVSNITITFKTTRGCPQGGVLSPLLWIMVVDNLIVKLNDSGFYAQGYADDIAILITGKHLNILSELTQTAIGIVEEWCIERDLNVNPRKTELICFSNKRSYELSQTPAIFGQPINFVDQVKYLGVVIDRKLSWQPHLLTKINKAIKAFWQCRRAFGQTWGLSPKVVFFFYTVIVRPMFAYAAVIWWHKCKKLVLKKRITQVQRLACLGITGAMKTTPTAALEIILSMTPLDLFCTETAAIAAYRLQANNSWISRGEPLGHGLIWSQVVQQLPHIGAINDRMVSEFNFSKPFNIKIPSRDWWSSSELVMIRETSILFFTDGSVSESDSGFGIVAPDLEVEVHGSLGCMASVFQTEIYAIIACAKEIKVLGLSNRNIVICSDSQAALKALANNNITSRLVNECCQALTEVASNNDVKLIWVPGHSNIPENERADALARLGATTQFVGPEPAIGVSFATGKSAIKQWITEQHIHSWHTSSGCRQSKMFLSKPCRRRTKFILGLSRIDAKHLVGCLTGHGSFAKHLTNLGIGTDPTCQSCLENDETAAHFVGECPAYYNVRRHLLYHTAIPETSLKDVNWNQILSFIKATKRFAEV